MDKIVDVIKNGGVVIMPTDTIYGIVADATNEAVIKKVYNLKKRENNKPMLILVNGVEMLENYVDNISDLERKLINHFWPGPLTIVFKKKNISDVLTGGLDTVGVRFPNDELIIDIINKANVPLLSTSVNISGSNTIYSVADIPLEILDGIDFVFDGGECKGEASTVVKIDGSGVKLLRNGKIDFTDVLDVIKN